MAGYLGTLGVLMLLTIAVSSIPEISLSTYVDWPGRRYWAAGLFLIGSLFSAIAFWLHGRRVATPWSVSRAHVTLPFLLGAVALLAAVITSR
jgi:hypothetical protein